jgi:hypothetical protein
MAFSRTCTFIYIGLVALLDRIQSSFSSITISTGVVAEAVVGVCIWPGMGGTITIDCQYTLPVDSEGGGKEDIGCAKRMQRFVDSGTMNRALS